MRVKPTRLILVFVLCWTSATLLVFLRIDDRIPIEKHGSRRFVHEDYTLDDKELDEDTGEMIDVKTNLDLLKRNNVVLSKTRKPSEVFDDLAKDKPIPLLNNIQDKDIPETAGKVVDIRDKESNNNDNNNKIPDQHGPAPVPPDQHGQAAVPPDQHGPAAVPPDQHGPAPVPIEGIDDRSGDLIKQEQTESKEEKFDNKAYKLPQAIYALQPPDAPGENGQGVSTNYTALSMEEQHKYDRMMKQNAFNEYNSLKISVRRRLPDGANPSCPRAFREDLQATSVIICFHNEAWTVLLRTVHSVLDRSPSHLVKEIILVDDFSDLDYLKEPLEYYMSKLEKIKIIRTPKREGLIRARLLGVDHAQGPVLVFLDSHVECFPNWLEPLLTRVKEDRRRIVAPIISMINSHNFQVGRGSASVIGIFTIADLGFKWGSLPDRIKKLRKSDADPYRTPTIAGGLFAVEKDYFIEMGKYDEGMEIWGSENVEISLRIWMCGGSLEIHPCSIVGHIFRSKSPYNWVRPVHLILRKNTVRLAEVWLDDYKKYYYERIGYQLGDFGNVTERKELRKSLQCQSFQWYIDNVYPEIEIPPKSLFTGEIRQPGRKRCLDAMNIHANGNLVSMAVCHGQLGNQLWQFTENKRIRTPIGCLSYSERKSHVIFSNCNDRGSASLTWSMEKDGHVVHIETKKCLDRNMDSTLNIANCSTIPSQIWEFKSINPST
ncbi:polypeptide N-acetylgalactosaminyltransferase [Mactra antiquata]